MSVDDELSESLRELAVTHLQPNSLSDIIDQHEQASAPDGTVEVSETDDEEDEHTLPPHRRCAAHTLNLVAVRAEQSTTSLGPARSMSGTSTSRYPRFFSKALGTLQALWNRQRRSSQVINHYKNAL